jgi:hypothetical protein
MMVRFGWEGREDEDGLRARTVTEWPRERALERTMRPLRPVAPEMKMCMLVMMIEVVKRQDSAGKIVEKTSKIWYMVVE